MQQPPIIVVAGPTASGKTRLAVELALTLDGEVLSCDSMQLYRHMDIGTAKPNAEEMRGVPHHMIDVIDPAESFSVGRYVEMAAPILEDIRRRGKAVILCGGTGLYADSLLLGRDFAPMPRTGRREELEALADRAGIEAVIERLRAVDPEAAARLHPSDRKRIIRAMEVYLETGQTITDHDRASKAQPPKYRALWLGLTFADRAALYDRINRRVDQMVESGLLEEARRFLESPEEKATAMQAIGYKELAPYFADEISLEEAVESIRRETRRYAKRQLTWFRRDPEIHWIEVDRFESWENVLGCAEQIISQERFLTS